MNTKIKIDFNIKKKLIQIMIYLGTQRLDEPVLIKIEINLYLIISKKTYSNTTRKVWAGVPIPISP
jgi:hypothetical protein